MANAFLRVWKKFSLNEIKQSLLIIGDLAADCAACRELGLSYGIEIVVVRPTSTETPFFDVEPLGKNYLENRGNKRMTAKKVAQLTYQGVMKHKRTVTISIHGKLALILNTLCPRFVDWVIGKIYGKLKIVNRRP